MMTREDNRFLTQTGPGTPMGAYLRSHWVPCMLCAEIPAVDEAPVRLRLLGEDLIVFRDTVGHVGVLEEHCPHRCASLFFGRNEDGGIRCVYHGWKFDVDGNCLEMPNEPASSDYRNKVKAIAYPTRERGGLLWVYMGTAGQPPQLPGFEWLDLPKDHRYASRWEQECNSIQAMEGEMDPSHVSFLHRRIDRLDEKDQSLSGNYFQVDRVPSLHVKDTDYGFIAASQRNIGSGKSYWRMNQYLLPFYTMITAEPGDALMTRMWVPKDDTHCWVIAVSFRTDAQLSESELQAWKGGEKIHRKVVLGTTQPTERSANDYLIDRNLQKRVSFTGITGVRAQDAMVTESAGPVVDRSREHLCRSDLPVIRMRRRLMSEAKSFVTDAALPVTAQNGELYRVRAHQAVLSSGLQFDEDSSVRAAMRC